MGRIFETSEGYPDKLVAGGLEVRTRNIVPNLRAQRQELMQRVEKIDKFLALLEKNPDLINIIDLSRELI